MKNRTNGAVKTAKTLTITDAAKELTKLKQPRREFADRCSTLAEKGVDLEAELMRQGVCLGTLPRDVEIMIATQKKEKATVKLELELPVWMYGQLCEAAAVHKLGSWQEAAMEFMRCNLIEWGEEKGFYLDW